MSLEKTIWTIGHSTRPIEEFIECLQSFGVELLVDIRSYPSSKYCPQFNEDALQLSLAEAAIDYLHLPGLGGRRKAKKDSENSNWKNASFRGYADYMETPEFELAVAALQAQAFKKPTAYMCAEAFWLKCHRSLVSDYLKVQGWTVMHIVSANKAKEHEYTKPARVEGGILKYFEAGD